MICVPSAENTVAYAHHVKKDYKAAAANYARALAADPTWPIPAYNLAGVETDLGDLTAAIAALAPWLAAQPLQTYLQVASDPELAPLLARSELRALHARTLGKVTLTIVDDAAFIGYSPERQQIAVTTHVDSSGVSGFTKTLELRDTTGRIVAAFDLVTNAETGTDMNPYGVKSKLVAKVKQRAAALELALANLGFSTAGTELATTPQRADDDKWRASFPRAKVGLVIKNNVARVLRKDTTLATATTLARLDAAALIPGVAVVIWSGDSGGCGDCPFHRELDVLPLKP